MSFAIRKDGQGWRAVNGPDDVGPDEIWQEEQPPIVEDQTCAAQMDPVQKLRQFLSEHPDVAAILQ